MLLFLLLPLLDGLNLQPPKAMGPWIFVRQSEGDLGNDDSRIWDLGSGSMLRMPGSNPTYSLGSAFLPRRSPMCSERIVFSTGVSTEIVRPMLTLGVHTPNRYTCGYLQGGPGSQQVCKISLIWLGFQHSMGGTPKIPKGDM